MDRLKQVLPAVPGINGKKEYFNSVVLVLLLEKDGEYYFVFERRSESIRQGGEICFPGGMFEREEDATMVDAAIRETGEELGIPAERIEILGCLNTVIAPMGATVDAFLAVSDVREEEIVINKNEVDECFLIPVAFFEKMEPERYQSLVEIKSAYYDEKNDKDVVLFPARELGLPEKYWNTWSGARHNILVYRTDKAVIWGITARLINEVIGRLKIAECRKK